MFSRISRFFRRAVVSQQQVQEQLDVAEACCMLKALEEIDAFQAEGRPPRTYEEVAAPVVDMDHEARAAYVRDGITRQLVQMFEAVNLVAEVAASSLGQAVVEGEDEESGSATAQREVHRFLDEHVGFHVEIARSGVKGAGEGVFVRREVPPGKVIALFPGFVHLPEHTAKRANMDALMPDDDFFLMQRYDKVIIDGRTAEEQPYNPFAMAHMANHPTTPFRANVIPIAYDFPGISLDDGGFPVSLRRYVPNAHARDPELISPVDHSAYMQTVVLITREWLHDQEVFVDYRLNPEAPNLPEWYEPCDKKAAQRRWDEHIDKL